MKEINLIGRRAAAEFKRSAKAHGRMICAEADALGVLRASYYQWRQGETDPSAAALQKMYMAGYDVVYILTGKRTQGEGRTDCHGREAASQ